MKSTVVCTVALFTSFASALYAKDSAGKVLPLSAGITYSGMISLPGQQDRFTFSGTPGQRFYFDTQDLDGEGINVQLVTPRGMTPWGISHSSDYGPFYLEETGTYTLLVDGSSDVVGDYSTR